MAMGVGYQEFWLLNPRTLSVVIEGYRLKRKVHDEEQWMLGGYMSLAVEVAIGNAFRKKGEKAHSYFEILEEPFYRSDVLAEKRKQKQIDALMASLHVMQNNFNLKHGK